MKSKQEIASSLEMALKETDVKKRDALISQAENDLYEIVKEQEPIEKNKFIQGLYSTVGFLGRGIGQLAKVYPTTGAALQVATPITETARMGVRALNPDAQYETPDPDVLAEIKSGIDISDRAGFGPLIKDIITASGGRNEGYIPPQSFAEEFPELSSFIGEATKPANIASLGLDYLSGSALSKKFAPKGNIINPRMVSEETALGYLKSISRDDKLMLDMLKEKENYKLLSPEKRQIVPPPRIDRIVNVIKENPDKYLKILRPRELFLTLQEDLSKLKNQQDFIVENMPSDKFTDAEDLQRLAISKLKGEEAGQIKSAKEIIRRNIPFSDIDSSIINSIDRLRYLYDKIKEKGKIIDGEKIALENELSIEKNSLIKTINETPDIVNNPKYDPVIDWIGSLEAVDSGEVFPKKYSGTSDEFFRSMDDYFSKLKDKNLSKDELLESLADFYRQNQPSTQTDPKGLSGVAFSPENRKWSGLLKQVKKETILPIIQGAAKEPTTIPNSIKQSLIESAIARISEINYELKELSNNKMKSGRNSEYLKIIDERKSLQVELSKLKESMHNRFGKIYSEQSDYVSDIDALNEVTPQYISKKRQLGNKLKTDYATMPTIEQKPLSLAGSAIESASSEIQDAIMSGADKIDFDLYKDTNREMSTKIPFRNLVEKNLLDDGGFTHIPAATPTGRTGLIESAVQMGPRFIRPTLSKVKYGIGNFAKTPIEASKYSGELMTAPSYKERADYVTREPQSLGLALASYEIPRNSKKILEEADLVLAKLAQNTTTPEGQVLFDAVHDAIKNNPKKVPKLMQILSQQHPGIFQYSETNSFDNIVPPENRGAVVKKLNNSKNLTNSEKARKIKALINEGYLDEF